MTSQTNTAADAVAVVERAVGELRTMTASLAEEMRTRLAAIRDARRLLDAELSTLERTLFGQDAITQLESPGSEIYPPTLAKLSPREWQVARIVATGATNAEASAKLFMAEQTVKNNLHSVFTKTGVRNRAELATWIWKYAGAEHHAQ